MHSSQIPQNKLPRALHTRYPIKTPFSHPSIRKTLLRCQSSSTPDVSVVAERIDDAFREVCVENQGRSAAAALSDFVASTLLSIDGQIPLDTLLLELEYGTAQSAAAGNRLTQADLTYRRRWVQIVLVTDALFEHYCGGNPLSEDVLASWSESHPSLFSIVSVTLIQLASQSPDFQIRFDRSLATRGNSGGVATEKVLLPPQFVPASQLVLLTVKHLQERKTEEPPHSNSE